MTRTYPVFANLVKQTIRVLIFLYYRTDGPNGIYLFLPSHYPYYYRPIKENNYIDIFIFFRKRKMFLN